MKIYKDIFEKIVSPENLFSAWNKFKSDKGKKKDVQRFEWELEQNIFQLHRELRTCTYKHHNYSSFFIRDPKQRHIHKAEVRDRILHHAIFRIINPIFEETFIANSFSCRIGKGTHKGVIALEKMIRKESKNYSKCCYILKCDVSKFFDTIDHQILMNILKKRIKDKKALWLLREVIESFSSSKSDIFNIRGVPIGNLTSQIFANVYMNELDQYIKQGLKIKHYARYTDDFVIVSEDLKYLQDVLGLVRVFLRENLALELHPKKVTIQKYNQGVDFLGYISFPHYRLVRVKTKRRIFKKLRKRVIEHKTGKLGRKSLWQCLQSYLGVLSHANAHKFSEKLQNQFWFWLSD